MLDLGDISSATLLQPQAGSLLALLQRPDFREGKHWQRRHYPEQCGILQEGELSNEIFVILSGQVRILSKVKLDEQRQIQPGLCDLGPGDQFGEACFFDDSPRSASVLSLSPCDCAVIARETLQDFLALHPDLAYPLLIDWCRRLLGYLRQSNLRVGTLLSWGLKQRNLDQHL